MTAMTVLYLYTNQLTGTLPAEWASMTALTELSMFSNQLTGTLPGGWSRMRSLVDLQLHVNRFVGTVPASWPEGMRRINTTGQNCTVVCGGRIVVGGDAECHGGLNTATTCVAVAVWYNCLEWLLPPVNASNPWNWNSDRLSLGPQRNDCLTPTISLTGTAALTGTSTITGSLTTSRSASPSESEELLLPQRRTLRSVSRPLTNSIAAMVALIASYVGGVGVGLTVQRASLQRGLMSCGEDGATTTEPLDVASSPLRLGYGVESGQYVRGSVVGDLALLAALGLLGTLVAYVRQDRHHRHETLAASAGRLQLPGLLHVPAMFLLQPVVAGSVWCLQSGEHGSGDVVVGLAGLALSVVYALWAVWMLVRGRVYFINQYIALPPWLQSVPSVVRGAVLGVPCRRTVWRDNGYHNRGYVRAYGTIFSGYLGGLQWFLLVELLLALLSGVLSGVGMAVPAACGTALPAVYLVLVVVALLITVIRQPYQEPLDHVVNVVGLTLSVAWSGCVLLAGSDDAAADAVGEVQMWLGVVTLGVVVLGLLSSARLRLWLACRFRLVERTEGDQEAEEEDGPLEGGEASTTQTGSKPNHQRASHETATTVTALAEQRLRKAVQWICRQQQTEQQQQEQRQQRRSRGIPPSPPRAPSRTQPTLSNHDRLAGRPTPRRSHSPPAPPPPARKSFQPSRAARAHVAAYIAQICRQKEEEEPTSPPL